MNNYQIYMQAFQTIVLDKTIDVYNNPKILNALIGDLLPNNETSDLLKVIIEKDASKLVYKIKDKDDIDYELKKAIEIISKKSFIPTEIIAPAFVILCAGIGIDASHIDSTTPKLQTKPITPPKPKTKTPSDFEIESGVLRKYSGNGINAVIPNMVTCIGDSAFEDCESLINVTIPNSVTSIGQNAFKNCNSLINISIPNSVTSFGSGIFCKCISLINMTLPTSMTTIERGMFRGCTSLTNIVIPDSVTIIEDDAFSRCNSLVNVTMSNSLTHICDNSFYACFSLTNIKIPKSVKFIGVATFGECHSLSNSLKLIIEKIQASS